MTFFLNQGKHEQRKAGVAILKANEMEFKAKISHGYTRMVFTGKRKKVEKEAMTV